MIEKLKAQAVLCAKRGVQMFASTLAAVLTANGTGIIEADWTAALSTAGMSGLLAVLYTVGGTYASGRGSSSSED